MDELISRQAAMDALNALHYNDREDWCFVLDTIEFLPSSQPEIIRCKDCKHRDPEDKKCDCGHDIRWQLPRQDDWFCADAERKEVTI